MRLLENIQQALASLRANKMRALLTMLGIIIGIAAVIAIITVGDALTNSLTDSMSAFGVNNVNVYLTPKDQQGNGSYMLSEEDLISDHMLDGLRQVFPDELEAISISDNVGSGQARQGRLYANLNLTGVNDEYVTANNLTVQSGRFFGARDQEGQKKVAVVSDKLVQNMFPDGEDPLGQQITIKVNSHVGIYTIVGVYQYNTGMGSMGAGGYASADKDITTDVYVPLNTAKRITGTTGYHSVTLLSKAGVDSTKFADDAGSYLNTFYVRNQTWNVMAYSMESMMEEMTSMMGTVQLAISAIAAISLLVGGIGVMNIMLVSITERTREIGVRKAIGATNTEIRIQFVVESMFICLVGGIIGMALGSLMGIGGAQLLGAPATPKLSNMLMASGISMLIGVFFGYYPANKAAKMDPIDALRYE